MGFSGYKRPDGSVGVRNHVLVMSSVVCANGVVDAIGRAVPEVKTVTHPEGCGRGIKDLPVIKNTLVGMGKNPNVAAVLVVGLGCEFVKAPDVAQAIRVTNKPVESIVIQEEGGTKKSTEKGISIVKKMLENMKEIKREECGFDKLIVGLECGGSDALSGVTANPLVGVFADWIVGQGGTVILSETTEMIGTEEVLGKRAETPEMAEQIKDLITKQREKTVEVLGPLASLVISPGNIEGGLTNITEKSLGCIIKAGNAPVKEIVSYAIPPTKKGLVIMDTPGSDIFSLTGMAAGGAQLMVFTTGRGSPAGFPTVPVIKVASNSDTYNNMIDDMDINAGEILEGKPLEEAGGDLVQLAKKVIEGEESKAEINRQECFAIYTEGPAF
jgi:altronate dehydratase large subunit